MYIGGHFMMIKCMGKVKWNFTIMKYMKVNFIWIKCASKVINITKMEMNIKENLAMVSHMDTEKWKHWKENIILAILLKEKKVEMAFNYIQMVKYIREHLEIIKGLD